MSTPPDTTQLLVEGRQGQKGAIDALMPRLHTELKQIAHRLLQKRPAAGVLDTTGLVHEAYLKLIDQTQVTWEDQAHFQALSARAMRQILVDHFRHQQAEKRGGPAPDLSFREGKIPVEDRGATLLALDEALGRLRARDARKAQVVMHRFFGGMSHAAIANVLEVSARTVRRDWRAAKAWLARELTEDGEPAEDGEPGEGNGEGGGH